MIDTPPGVAERYRNLLMKRSGLERLQLGADMLVTARELAIAGFGSLDPGEIRKTLFLRFHGHEFTEERRKEIAARLLAYRDSERSMRLVRSTPKSRGSYGLGGG